MCACGGSRPNRFKGIIYNNNTLEHFLRAFFFPPKMTKTLTISFFLGQHLFFFSTKQLQTVQTYIQESYFYNTSLKDVFQATRCSPMQPTADVWLELQMHDYNCWPLEKCYLKILIAFFPPAISNIQKSHIFMIGFHLVIYECISQKAHSKSTSYNMW